MPLNLAETCPNLRELLLPTHPYLPPALLPRLPYSSLKHIELGEDISRNPLKGIMLRKTIDWVMSLPKLQPVTFHLMRSTFDPNDCLVTIWKERCVKNVQIEYLCKETPSWFTAVDLIRDRIPQFPYLITGGTF
ncbi:hypothetical protein FRC03_008228 [Tulasnella sp. 419]|nr:hypothetical protein FRC03_008228 [Tulasnella sp. 419]